MDDYHFLVVTNAHGWGRGSTKMEAMVNALKHSGRNPTKFRLIETKGGKAWVSDFGGVCYDKVTVTVTDDTGWQELDEWVYRAFCEFEQGFEDMMFEIEYPEDAA